jgi:ABC-type antimicrobial peptide transport system permease subunit
MRRELLPYYVSRLVLSSLFGVVFALSAGSWWMGLAAGLLVFAGFIWYAHSGHYMIDPSRPLAPLRRDERGKAIRDRAVVAGVVVGGLVYAALGLLRLILELPPNLGGWALLSGAVTYFVASHWLYARR